MAYVVYFATFLSCLGNVFIILKNKLGFWIWIAGNIAWIYVDWFTPNMKPQIIMMVVYAGLNVWGLVEWSRGINILNPLWEIHDEIRCADCGTVTKGYRIVKARNYDKTGDKFPEFRCEKCSRAKLEELKSRGVI